MSTDTFTKNQHVLVLDAIQRHTQAENPSSFLAVSRGNEVFTLPGVDGVVVYRPTGRHLVQLGGPFAAAEGYDELVAGFMAHARQEGRALVAVQLQADDATAYRRHGFTVNQIGASWAVGLADFTLRGTRFMQLRNKISRAFRSGLKVEEVDAKRNRAHLDHIDRTWLPSKGEHARQLEFLVGEIGGPAQTHRRLFLGTIDGEAVGYISYSPVYGGRAGWMHDLSRRVPGGSPGLMEAINHTAIETFRAEGARWLHFGFTPFTGLDETLEVPGHSPAFQWLTRFLWEQGAALYPAQSQLAYKEKRAPNAVIPEYVGFDGQASLPGLAHVFRACNAF